ncbi:DUF2382 domain-containing protein [Pontibacter sp. 172403-2]|uniref:YsnF/AvaK domain-containing protein n=1 Tax=Pontibacter rufus TaxID=2791028 RepID=UPI0018AF6201|nr:YsnF/AvaK domain-containing protein [Pontibacter sp. 172403-2]MBF9254670.1 DUF2382 domain-containing protein [Pontibacter sp. 172403-2]
MGQTVIGIFDNKGEAQSAVAELTRSGISRNNIDVSDRTDADVNSGIATDTHREEHTDSISEFFSNLFGGDDDDDRYSHYSEVARRGSIVTVHAQSQEEATRAAAILDDHGAVDIDERASQYRSGTIGAAGIAGTAATAGADTVIPIIEENMQVGKRDVETGGVRVRSRIVERPVEEHLRLREEHVWVERNPVNRPASEADLANFKEGDIEMTEHAEVPVVNKEARVVEEINVGKEVEEREENIRGTVRKTDVDIENIREDDNLNRTDERNRPAGL